MTATEFRKWPLGSYPKRPVESQYDFRIGTSDFSALMLDQKRISSHVETEDQILTRADVVYASIYFFLPDGRPVRTPMLTGC